MKLKKQLASLAVMGMMSLAAASSAFAAGVGYVNFDALVQAHKDFPKVSAQMQSAIKDANDKFAIIAGAENATDETDAVKALLK